MKNLNCCYPITSTHIFLKYFRILLRNVYKLEQDTKIDAIVVSSALLQCISILNYCTLHNTSKSTVHCLHLNSKKVFDCLLCFSDTWTFAYHLMELVSGRHAIITSGLWAQISQVQFKCEDCIYCWVLITSTGESLKR